MASVIISQANDDTPAVGGLFNGLAFFLVQRVPSRSHYISQIQANGGRVVKLEAQADHVIADHVRRDAPPGSISYRFIEQAIKDGAIPDPDDHKAGPPVGAVREVGSVVPGKSTRTAFTAEDDRVLWQWVEKCKGEGGMVKGNEIYKQLEARNPRHTFQAWRDRYIKRLMHQPPPNAQVKVAANAPPTPPTAPDQQDQQEHEPEQYQDYPLFTTDNFDELMKNAEDIMNVVEDQIEDAWKAWAQTKPDHTADEWRRFWEDAVRPVWLREQEQEQEKKKGAKTGRKKAEEESGGRLGTDGGIGEGSPASVSATDDTPSGQIGKTAREARGPGLQKRKREALTSEANATDGRKKQKAQTNHGNMAVDVLQTSDADEASEEQLHEKENTPTGQQKVTRQSTDVTLPTSDLNKGADQQLRRESLEGAEDPDGVGVPLEPSNLPTSEANRAADRQIRRESLEGIQGLTDPADADIEQQPISADSMPPSEPTDLVISNYLVEDGEVEDGLPGQEIIEPDDSGDALTEANLASQQAQHNAQLRGADLSEDDNEQDQTEFLDYLHSVLGQKANAAAEEAAEETPKATRTQLVGLGGEDEADVAMELPSAALLDQTQYTQNDGLPSATFLEHTQYTQNEGLPPPDDDREQEVLPFPSDEMVDVTQYTQNETNSPSDDTAKAGMFNLPVSSQQEVDDVLETNLQWPSSPQQQKHAKAPASASQGFETQIAYPSLPGAEVQGPEEDELSSSQLLQSQIVDYPTLPEQPSEQDKPALSEGPEAHAPAAVLTHEDDEFELTVPEPEGGWDNFSTSALDEETGADDQDQEAAMIRDRPQDTQAQQLQTNGVAATEVSSAASPSSPYVSSEASSSPPKQPAQKARVLHTQDILDAETQKPDLDMPLPPDSDEEFEALPKEPLQAPPSDDGFETIPDDPLQPPSSPALPVEKAQPAPIRQQVPHSTRPPQSQPSQQRDLAQTHTLEEDDINTYITTLNIRRGYTEASIIDALKTTSMRPELAELVLLEQKAGKGVPRDVPGIWTEDEDRIVESGDARRLKKLEQKHGWEEIEARLAFLEEWRGAE